MGNIKVDWDKLSVKQRELVLEYMRTGNKIQSYMKVYRGPGVEQTKNMFAQCYKIFAKPHVKVIVQQIQQEAIQRTQFQANELIQANVDDLVERHQQALINATWVLERAAQLANFNIAKFIKVHNGEAVYDFSEATEDDWYCIQEYSNDPAILNGKDEMIAVNKIRLKAHDKLRALELVGKHIDIGAFKDRVELSGDQENPVQTITRKIVKPDGDAD